MLACSDGTDLLAATDDFRPDLAVLDLSRCGFGIAGVTENLPALRELVASAQPSVVVLAVPLPGVPSLAAVHLLRRRDRLPRLRTRCLDEVP